METIEFHITKAHFFLRTIFILHLSGIIEQIYTHNEMFICVQIGLISPLDTSVPNIFLHF